MLYASQVSGPPVLPAELERKIFELAFDPDPRCGADTNRSMLLVARRVRIWLRPLTYRVLMLRFANSYPILSTCPEGIDIDEITSMVEHFLVDSADDAEIVAELIAKCPSVQNLAWWGAHDIMEIFDSISKLKNLRRISGTFHNVGKEQLLSPAFASVTHLELLFPRKTWPFEALNLLQHLTHLLVYGEDELHLDYMPTIISFCASLEVLIVCTTGRRLPDSSIQILDAEPRLVVFEYAACNAEDWINGAYGGRDIWWHAETFVFSRKRQYFISDDYRTYPISRHFDWMRHLTGAGKEWYLSL